MKRICTIIAAVFITASLFAQSPEKMNYQAVVRDAGNNLIANTPVGIQITILKGSENGTPVYTERHFPLTNANGLFSIKIGTGTIIDGDFTAIDWANDTYFIKTETDINGGADYTFTGTNQLLSVPYALHAKSAGSVTDLPDETDPVFGESVASGITPTDTANWNNKLASEEDGSTTNELQEFSVSSTGDTLFLSQANWVIIPGLSMAADLASNLIMNGSFENHGQEACTYNLSNEDFNATMENVYSYGVSEQIDIHTFGCYVDPQHLDWCIGLAARTGQAGYDAVNLELSSPLKTGSNYELSFWTYGNTTFSALEDSLKIGFSNNTDTFDKELYTVLPAENVWENHTIQFTAESDYPFVSVRIEDEFQSGWIQVDNFHLKEITNADTKSETRGVPATFSEDPHASPPMK